MTSSTASNSWLNRAKRTWPFSLLYGAISPSGRARLRRTVDRLSAPSVHHEILAQVGQTNDLLARLLYEQLRLSPRATDTTRLLHHGYKVYSQHDEDGIIEEIFRRVGSTNRYFVEFGAGDGLENCTLYLVLKGWRGAWIDGSAVCHEMIQRNLESVIREGRLRARHALITAENIEHLFRELDVPAEFDLLSIDIDRNDYWVWRAIAAWRPRVVAIEYNASFGPTASCVVPYDPYAVWNLTNWFGASLKALEHLGREKGYSLVGCNLTGVTAFFVRRDLAEGQFAAPFTAENHFESAKYFLRMPNGHRPGFGATVCVGPDAGASDSP
ncbi:MAG TPA: hypothetical protein VLE53_09835 [Gemmatimonadaceae bacterium]|nr:hypothetical protein [Gemmatimonadaceae bacterium]